MRNQHRAGEMYTYLHGQVVARLLEPPDEARYVPQLPDDLSDCTPVSAGHHDCALTPNQILAVRRHTVENKPRLSSWKIFSSRYHLGSQVRDGLSRRPGNGNKAHLDGARSCTLFPRSAGRTFFSRPFWRYPPFARKPGLSIVVIVQTCTETCPFTVSCSPFQS